MNKDWKGDFNSVFKTLGASSHTDKERQNEDFYATEPKASELLLEIEDFYAIKTIWDNSCGTGTLLKAFEDKGFNIIATDLVDRGYGQGGIDFLKLTREDVKDWNFDAIVMNPPYKYAKEFVEHSIELLPEHGKLFAFLKLQFLEGKGRKFLFERNPPETVWVSSSRLLCAKNGQFQEMVDGGGSAVCYCWMKWSMSWLNEKNEKITTLKWFN
jgi:hypothetical protein